MHSLGTTPSYASKNWLKSIFWNISDMLLNQHSLPIRSPEAKLLIQKVNRYCMALWVTLFLKEVSVEDRINIENLEPQDLLALHISRLNTYIPSNIKLYAEWQVSEELGVMLELDWGAKLTLSNNGLSTQNLETIKCKTSSGCVGNDYE